MALVLSRKRHETIVIADEVKVTVLEIRGTAVRLRIEAPTDTSIHREEIWQQIQEEASADVNRVATPSDGESGRQVANTQEA